MKQAGTDIRSFFGPPTKRSKLCEDTTDATRPDVSVAAASSATDDFVTGDIASLLSHGATSEAQVKPDISVATGSSAADDSVSGDIASYLSCGATTTLLTV